MQNNCIADSEEDPIKTLQTMVSHSVFFPLASIVLSFFPFQHENTSIDEDMIQFAIQSVKKNICKFSIK